MLTPSLVMVGAPHFFSRTTLRPLGPRVTLTASARVFIPRSRPRRASSLKAISFGITPAVPHAESWEGFAAARDGRPGSPDGPFPPALRASTTDPGCHSQVESANSCLALDPGECKTIRRASDPCPDQHGRPAV